MAKDKFKAVWVSHSSISDFLTCPRAYYLNNVYKNPKTGNKIQVVNPPMSLGLAVHSTLEKLSVIPTKDRFRGNLLDKYEKEWEKVSGKKGGFLDKDTESHYKKRGEEMIRRVIDDPGPLLNLAVKIKMDLPWFWLSEEDEIILCGKIDWLEYDDQNESVHIIDFKTGKVAESEDSLQLPIYHLLVANCQGHDVSKASYWYLDQVDGIVEQNLPDLDESRSRVMKIAKKIKLARQLDHFECPQGEDGCWACQPLESVISGDAEFVGTNKDFGKDLYVVEDLKSGDEERDGEIL